MAALHPYARRIHEAIVRSAGDWESEGVVCTLDECDQEYLLKCHGERTDVDRSQVLTCLQNFRHRTREEYVKLFGKGDEGLAEYLAATNLLTAEQQDAFLNMTQSKRLRAVRFAPYHHITDASWGGDAWRAIGVSADVSRERTALRQDIRHEAYPLVFDMKGLHDRVVQVGYELVSTLECPTLVDYQNNLQSRRILARLLSLSLYGIGTARFSDITPGLASRVGGGVARNMGEVMERHARCVRYFHISKTTCERARWRVCLFPDELCDRIIRLLDDQWQAIALLAAQQPNWIQRALATKRNNSLAWEGIDLDSFAIVPETWRNTPYAFKHLGLSVLPHIFHVTSVLSVRGDVLACQLGHSEWNRTSTQNYGVFDSYQTGKTYTPTMAIKINDDGLYVTLPPSVRGGTDEGYDYSLSNGNKRTRCR